MEYLILATVSAALCVCVLAVAAVAALASIVMQGRFTDADKETGAEGAAGHTELEKSEEEARKAMQRFNEGISNMLSFDGTPQKRGEE